jgi:ATP adenylyltransferase
MDRIWAPWRMEYIASTKCAEEQGCFLCTGNIDDPDSLVVARKGKAFVVMNKYPYANAHVMVVPERHVGNLEDLTDEELLDMIRLLKLTVKVLKETVDAGGVNIGVNMGRAAGAGLEEHIHIHVVPRWFGDTNFMPVLGETKIISEHLNETCRKLKERFEKLL